jgi:uncharacterized membrane protein
MEPFVCVGLIALFVPIALIVAAVIELRKLKKAVRELGRRLSRLEAGDSPREAQPAPMVQPSSGSFAHLSVPPPLPRQTPATQPALPKQPPIESIPIKPAPPRPARPAIDWEAFLGIKLFAWIGGFVLFLGMVFLVKYSFENNLITPAMRVFLGALIGVSLVAVGWITANRRYRVSGQSLCATGVLVLYGNTFAAHVFYHLITLVPAFVSMAIVTAAAFFLAVSLDAQVIVILGLLGGFLTPVLLSTGVDNPPALFGYIALLNVGTAAVALRKRWEYLVLLAAAGTVLMEFGWAARFFDYPKANTAFIVFLGFETQFLVICGIRRQINLIKNWVGGAAILVGLASLVWGFCFLDYPQIGRQPAFLFSLVFIAEIGLIALGLLVPRATILIPACGLVVFAFLAAWTSHYLNEALLWWALGGYVIFALLHGVAGLIPKREQALADFKWHPYLPLLPLVLICVCVGNNQTSAPVWICVLILNVTAVAIALSHRSLTAIAIALAVTLFAAGFWVLTAPLNIDLTEFLLVAVGSGIFFFSVALFAARRFFPGSARVGRELPSFAASLPYLLLLMAIAKLPIVDPTKFFIAAFFLSALLLGLALFSRDSWIALVGLVFTWAIEREWQTLHLTNSHAPIAIGWEVAFCLLFLGYPFFTAEDRKPLPWAVSAISGPLHFWLIYEIIRGTFPNLRNGLVPGLFVIPYAVGTIFLLKKKGATPESGDSRLALQAGSALFFISLIFPIQFEREWITLGWALEGFALLWLFLVVPHRGLRYVGVGLLCLAFVRLALNPAVLEYHRRAPTPIWNWYLYGYGLPIVLLFGGARLFHGERSSLFERMAPTLLNSFGAILLFFLMNIEIADYFSIGPTLTFSFSGNFARDMTYSIAWALFAFALLLVGMKQENSWVRYAGVVLLLVTLIKLFLHDLGNLSQLYRIGAFIGVALVLIVASFLYQRFLIARPEKGGSPAGSGN